VLARVAQVMVLSVCACGACGTHSSADAERSSAAGGAVFGADSNEADVVLRAMPKTVTASEALCPVSLQEMPELSGSPLWLQSDDAGEISSVASDSAGNVVLARSGTEVQKLSCAGTPSWSKPFGTHVAIDSDDNVYVAGSFSGTLAVGDGTLQTDGTSAFLVKLDAAGNVAYARALDEADGAVDSLAVDSEGHVALSGRGFGTLKLGDSGNLLWRKAFSGKVQFDSAGNLLLAGQLVGTLQLDSGRTLESEGGSDVLLLKLDANGAPVFAHRYGDAGTLQQAEALAVDHEDNVVVAGTFDGRIDFGAGPLELTPAQCSSDAWCVTNGFAAKLDAQGRASWSVAFGPMRAVSGVAIDLNGNTVVSGALPGGVRPFRQTWLTKLDTNGAELWRRSEWPDTGIGAGHGVAIDGYGRVFWSLRVRPTLELEERSYLAKLTP
jgi:hypothetical protein